MICPSCRHKFELSKVQRQPRPSCPNCSIKIDSIVPPSAHPADRRALEESRVKNPLDPDTISKAGQQAIDERKGSKEETAEITIPFVQVEDDDLAQAITVEVRGDEAGRRFREFMDKQDGEYVILLRTQDAEGQGPDGPIVLQRILFD